MNVIDSTQQLIEFFMKSDVFELNTHFKQVIPLSLNKEQDEASLTAALEMLVTSGYVSKVSLPNKNAKDAKTYWVLNRPLNNVSQSVVLTGNVAAEMAGMINHFCDVVGNKECRCNPLNVTERDIVSLMEILQNMATRLSQVDNEEKDENSE